MSGQTVLDELNAALRALMVAKRLLKDSAADVALRVFEAECRIRRAILAEHGRHDPAVADLSRRLREALSAQVARIVAIERGTIHGRAYRKTAYDHGGFLLELDLGELRHEEGFLGTDEEADARLSELAVTGGIDDDRR
ncbi:MAG: hypothetical protein KIS66_13630 [Fimbriimonadaceae bacterium]|nr:hypothetical protein [Fimbriimonadaceae bacterium]